MNNHSSYYFETGRSFGSRILAGIFLVVFLGALFYVGFKIYTLLFWVCPILIIAALIIQPSVVWDHIKNLGKSFKLNPIGGILQVGLQFIGLPLVSAGLLFKAWAYKKFGQLQNQATQNSFEEKYTPYEEIELDSLNKPKQEEPQKQKQNAYDDLFV